MTFMHKYNNNNFNHDDDNVRRGWYESKLFDILCNTINYRLNDELSPLFIIWVVVI